MRCHYEVLGVPHEADDAEIKRNYRKLALQNHPDKNPDNIEECTRIFHEVQSAYEVLSDKQERAWYDKHRERILLGDEEYVDESVDVMHFFNPSVYKGFGDDREGFYAVFRDVFTRISEEDEAYLEGDEEYNVPEFGDSRSDVDHIKSFYSFWLGYCTKKTFVWKEKYDLKQAPNRPTQRLMEKENKKLRDTAKRKRNEEVRALVAFVKKRDKRMQEYRKQLEERQAENQLKLDKKREENIRKSNQLLENYQEQEWMAFDHSKLDDIDSHFDEQFGSKTANSDDSDNENVDYFYCIACDKNFKSAKALANHEKSKKHKENVDLIRSELAEDLLQDLHIDSVKNNLGDNLVPKDGYERLSSLNLPDTVVKLNVIEKCVEDKNADRKSESDDNEDNNLVHHTDSLIHAKKKLPSGSQGSLKVKDKKKKNRQQEKASDEVFQDEEEWSDKYKHLLLSSQDSLALPRKKTKRQEIKDSAERVRSSDNSDLPQDARGASLGRTSVMNSLKLKRPTKSDRKKGRRNLLNIEIGDSSDESDENDAEIGDVTTDENGKECKDTVTDGSVKEDDEPCDGQSIGYLNANDSIPYHMNHMVHHGKKSVHQTAGNEVVNDQSSIGFKNAIDSIPYHMNHMEHHGKKSVNQTDKQTSSDECEKEPRLLQRTPIADSIRYNKQHMEHRGKNILLQKKYKACLSVNEEDETQADKKGTDPNVFETFTCAVCSKQYPTRNKLFEHIKNEGHAMLKEVEKNKKGKKGKNKK